MLWFQHPCFVSLLIVQPLISELMCSVRLTFINLISQVQMKDRWESNINVWFPFMYSQIWNCYFQNRLIMSVSQFLHSYICERFTVYIQDRSAYSAAGKYVDRSLAYINRDTWMWKLGQAAQFPEKEYINGILVAVCSSFSWRICYFCRHVNAILISLN
jgi:hypothetical protein